MTGNLILEILRQNHPIPQSVIDYANNKGIIIRDVKEALIKSEISCGAERMV